MSLIDFGLARDLIRKKSDASYSFNGNIMFSSSNQISGKEASAKDDIESLMYILYYLLNDN